jgi:hypothetical protein
VAVPDEALEQSPIVGSVEGSVVKVTGIAPSCSRQIDGSGLRDRVDISGPNFRNTGTVVRDVYALRGEVRAGNSGGPLFDPDGRVLGVVFASAIDDPETGYALTVEQVAEAASQGSRNQSEVPTGACE